MGLKISQNLTKMVKCGQKWPFFDPFLDKNGQKITEILKMRKNAHMGVVQMWFRHPIHGLINRGLRNPAESYFYDFQESSFHKDPPLVIFSNMAMKWAQGVR